MKNSSDKLQGKQKAFLYFLLLIYLAVPIADILMFSDKDEQYSDGGFHKVAYDNYNRTNQSENDEEFNTTFHAFNTTKKKDKNEISFETYFYINEYSNILLVCIDFLFIILICVGIISGLKCMGYCCCLCGGSCVNCLFNCALNHPVIIQFLISLLNFIIMIILISRYGAVKDFVLLLLMYAFAIIATIVYWCLSKFKFNNKSIPPVNKPSIEVNPQDISTTQVKVNQPESGKTILN